ncbi:MAG: homoserine kinase, partial [Actinomycetota bacterium]
MNVEVRVPATVANLGPGFDCLGVAVGMHLQARIDLSPAPEVAGEGPLRPPERNLTYRSFLAAHEACGRQAPPIRIEVLRSYASARGMGASASAIVAGLVAARELSELDLPDPDLARLAIEIEGHADNVLPALFGGLVLASRNSWMHLDPTPAISPVIIVSPHKMMTGEARGVLPREVPRSDAVANAAALSALVAVLGGLEPPEGLLPATEDRLHQPYRLPLMAESARLLGALRAEGIAAALAGSGPSIVCLAAADAAEDCARLAGRLAPEGWEVLIPG